MFSHRVPSDHSANRLSVAIEARRAAGASLLDLTESNPTRCGFHYDEAALLAALAHPGALLYEPHPQGLPVARRAVAAYYAERGHPVDPESLFLTTGTSEAYAHVFTLIADPGDEILVPTPGYPLLEALTGINGVRLVAYRQVYDEGRGWRIDTDRLRASISTRSRAIVVVSPNNPTGAYLKTDERDELDELCRTFDLALVVDEVFSDYGRGEDPHRVKTAVSGDGALTFVLNGLSKLVGLPQVKLGWVHVGGPREEARRAGERLAFITDAFLSVSASVQHAAAQIISRRASIQEQILRRLRTNDRVLAEAAAGSVSCRLLKREGGWYAVLELLGHAADEELALRLLEEDGVLVHPGYFYDFQSEGFLVLSLLTPEAEFREGVSRLVARIQDLPHA